MVTNLLRGIKIKKASNFYLFSTFTKRWRTHAQFFSGTQNYNFQKNLLPVIYFF